MQVHARSKRAADAEADAPCTKRAKISTAGGRAGGGPAPSASAHAEVGPRAGDPALLSLA